MLPLLPFINRFCQMKSSRFNVYFLALLLVLQGCTHLSEQAEQPADDIDTMSKDIVDMVDISSEGDSAIDSGKTRPSQLENALLPQAKRNLYLEQEKMLMSGIPKDVIADFEKALAAMKKEQWHEANVLFDKVINVQPLLSGSYVNKALIAMKREQWNVAEEQVDKAIEVNNLNPFAHNIKGQLLRLSGQFTQAEQSYTKALSIWPDYQEAQLNMAVLLELYRGRLLEARQYYQTYLDRQPNDEKIQRWLAGLDIKIRRAGLALPVEKQTIEQQTTEPSPLIEDEQRGE